MNLACRFENTKVVKLLVEHGASVYSNSRICLEPIHSAVTSGKPALAKYLLGAGIDPELKFNGFTLLQIDCSRDKLAVVTALLQIGAASPKPYSESSWSFRLHVIAV
jgi:ankyrin repeat protein